MVERRGECLCSRLCVSSRQVEGGVDEGGLRFNERSSEVYSRGKWGGAERGVVCVCVCVIPPLCVENYCEEKKGRSFGGGVPFSEGGLSRC